MQILRVMDKPKLWSNEWFLCWQPLLLLGVNSPFKGMREEVRARLGIILDRNILVNRLMRNSFRIKIGENEYQETFYGKPVFAIALKREWNWLWNLVHKWDMSFANHYVPKLNLGFDTLTSYPDANPETTTVDGQAYIFLNADLENWDTFANLRSGSGNTVDDSGTTMLVGLISNTPAPSDYYTRFVRAFALFDSSSLTSLADISNAGLSLYCEWKLTQLGSPDLHVCASTPASNTSLATADYSQIGSVSFANIANASINASGYNDFTLDANGIANISKTSISKFGARFSWDMNNTTTGLTWADNSASYFRLRTAENANPSSAPKLVVTYTIPATFVPQINII